MNKFAYKLRCSMEELQLTGTLNGGQSFRWKNLIENGTELWIGVFADKVWCLKQQKDCILYDVYESEDAISIEKEEETYNNMLRDYFRLDTNLAKYYEQWSSKDKHFEEASQKFHGIRILKQDPVENVFSFICSSNNHISRISSMVEKLALFYGKLICKIKGEQFNTFPTIESLAKDGVECKLKENGFGYRAKYIANTARNIAQQGSDEWLQKLKKMDYENARKTLMTLTGIGPKVADCICLMSLNHLQAVPIDTHVYQIARRIYMPDLPQNKTVTEKIYREIGEHFRNLYGPMAGWAHTVLFCADLKKFQTKNPTREDCNKVIKRKKR